MKFSWKFLPWKFENSRVWNFNFRLGSIHYPPFREKNFEQNDFKVDISAIFMLNMHFSNRKFWSKKIIFIKKWFQIWRDWKQNYIFDPKFTLFHPKLIFELLKRCNFEPKSILFRQRCLANQHKPCLKWKVVML